MKINYHTRRCFIEAAHRRDRNGRYLLSPTARCKRLPQRDAGYLPQCGDRRYARRPALLRRDRIGRGAQFDQHVPSQWHLCIKMRFACAIEIDSYLNLRFQRIALDTDSCVQSSEPRTQ